MKRISKTALSMALAAGSMLTVLPTAAQAQKKDDKTAEQAEQRVESPTKAYRDGYSSAVTLFEAQDFAGAKTAFDASVGSATAPNDMYWAGTLGLQLGIKLDDKALQQRGIEMVLNSGLAGPDEKARYSFFAGQFAYQTKDYAKAVERLQQAYDAGYRENSIEATLAEANNNAGNSEAAFQWLNTAVENRQAAGQEVPENWYKRGAALALEAQNYGEASSWLTRLVKAYPNKTNWRDTLVVYRDGTTLTEQENLDLLRLMRRVGALTSERDYGEYVEAADPRKLPGEVIAVVGEAQGAGLNSSTYLNEQLSLAQGNVEADKAGLSGAESDSRTAADGKTAAVTADAYLGYADYAKAEDLYSVALEKGGVNADEVHMRRGLARMELGDMAGAREDFNAIQSGNRQSIAQYWLVYIDQQAGGASAAASAPS